MKTISIEAEQSVIGAVLLDPSLIDEATELLTADDFYSAGHRDIFRSIQEMQAKQIPVDHISLSEHMQNHGREADLSYLVEVSQNTPSTANWFVYARIVSDRAKKRALQSALDLSSRAINDDGAATAEELTARAAALIGGLQCTDGQGARNTNELLKSLIHKWDDRSRLKGSVDGLETGIDSLDKRFMGWKPGNLIVIAGRPSMGKSVLAFQVGLHNAVHNAKRILGFSLEMTGEELLQRMTANLGSVHLDVFRKCDEQFNQHQDAIMSATYRLKNADLIIDDTPQMHINQIMARARNHHRKAKVDLVIVDHINIARGDGQSREREIAHISGSLKALAKELGCPIIAVTQLNRAVEAQSGKKRPNMSHLRDSGSIEQDADIVILLYRDEYYDENTDDKGVIELITGKFREGETGTDHCAALLHMSKIGNLDYAYQPKSDKSYKGKRGGFD